MQANTIERARVAVTVPVACKLVAWKAKPGDVVQAGQLLALMDDNEGPLELTAPTAGTLGKTIRPGATIARSGIVAYITPETRHNGHQSATATPAPVVSAPDRYTSHDALQPPRRGFPLAAVDLPPVEELAIVPESGPMGPASSAMAESETRVSLAKTSKPQKRQRTRHATYHVTEAQQTGLKRLVASLTLKDISTSESELVRAALQLLLDLPEPALLALVEKNQAREKAGKYGRGYPRPGRR